MYVYVVHICHKPKQVWSIFQAAAYALKVEILVQESWGAQLLRLLCNYPDRAILELSPMIQVGSAVRVYIIILSACNLEVQDKPGDKGTCHSGKKGLSEQGKQEYGEASYAAVKGTLIHLKRSYSIGLTRSFGG